MHSVPKSSPTKECATRSTINAYNATKLMIEQILEDMVCADLNWQIKTINLFNSN